MVSGFSVQAYRVWGSCPTSELSRSMSSLTCKMIQMATYNRISTVVPFWGYLIGSYEENQLNQKKELQWIL